MLAEPFFALAMGFAIGPVSSIEITTVVLEDGVGFEAVIDFEF